MAHPIKTIARLDADNGCLRFFDLPDNGITYQLRPQGDDIYWKGFTHGAASPGTPEASARLWRTDVNTGDTVELEPDQLALTLTTDVLGQDERNLYVTTGFGNLIRIAK